MTINTFKHPILDGIVNPDDQAILDKYVVAYGVGASSILDANGSKQWPNHTVTLDDGRKVEALWRGQRDLEDHTEKNLIKQTTSNGNVRYYMLVDTANESALKKIVDEYVQYVTSDINHHVHEEQYKFDALKHFQATFDIDAADIAENLKVSLSKAANLADANGYYPSSSLYNIALAVPQDVRNALKILYSDERSELERIRQFQEIMIPLSEQYSKKTVSHPYNMDLRFISLLLSLRYPNKFIYFKPTEVDAVYKSLYGEKTGTSVKDASRVIKTNNLGLEILKLLKQRPEFQNILEAMEYNDQDNLWFAQDVIWWAANHRTSTDELAGLEAKIKTFLTENPDFLGQVELTKEQIDTATTDFKNRFSPQKLREMTDEEIERSVIYNVSSTKDGLSYILEHSSVIGRIGGIRGGSAGKMGYYQGQDGQWKKFQSNAVTTKEDVLRHRRIDIEVLSTANEYITAKDFDGLASYQKALATAAAEPIRNNIPIADSDERYKSVVLGLVWVRKYFAILHLNEFVGIYGNDFVDKLEKLANIGDINGDQSDGDYSLWYRKMNRIAGLAPKFNISVYELSRILWTIINQENVHETEEESTMNEDETAIALNTIIYGPPGTGKTYSIQGYKNSLINNQQSKFENLINGSVKDTLLFIFKLNGNYPQNSFDIWRSEQFQTLQEYNGRTKSNGSAIRNELAYDDVLFERVEDNGVKYKATEEGLDYIQSILDAKSEESTPSTDDFYQFITFHQSYGYEEFIEGIRAETNDNGNIRYVVRDGVFKSFCRRAEGDPDNNYLFVIDEINRGNISKVFGELITLIEPNKRLGASEELTSTLPYSGEKFGVPKNVYIIGTMNTADRSIALLDIALRRRFDFKEILPDPSLLSSDAEGVNLQQLLATINAKVVNEIDRNHQIGHSYLMGINTLPKLHAAWYQRIVPLLQEYFYDDNDDLRSILKSFIDKDEVVIFTGNEFKQALIGIYEETQSTDSGIQR